MLRRLLFLLIFTFFTLPAFAATVDDEFDTYESSQPEEFYDPYEKINRKVFAFNNTLDRYLLEPIAKTYRKSLPEVARDAIHNFLNNLSLPISSINSLAQGKTDNALATFSNFLINSTIGLAGFIDVASQKGIFYKYEDFGQTLGIYGSGSGAYFMLPIIGPSSTRDLGGFIVDRAVSPVGFNVFEVGGKRELMPLKYFVGIVIISGIDTREGLIDVVDNIRSDSFDPYATIRSAYLQKRLNDIKN